MCIVGSIISFFSFSFFLKKWISTNKGSNHTSSHFSQYSGTIAVWCVFSFKVSNSEVSIESVIILCNSCWIILVKMSVFLLPWYFDRLFLSPPPLPPIISLPVHNDCILKWHHMTMVKGKEVQIRTYWPIINSFFKSSFISSAKWLPLQRSAQYHLASGWVPRVTATTQ